MGVSLKNVLTAGASTALEQAGKELSGLTDKSTGTVGAPSIGGVPAGTKPATSTSAAPPAGNVAQAPNVYSVPVWVWVVGAVAFVALGYALIRKG